MADVMFDSSLSMMITYWRYSIWMSRKCDCLLCENTQRDQWEQSRHHLDALKFPFAFNDERLDLR